MTNISGREFRYYLHSDNSALAQIAWRNAATAAEQSNSPRTHISRVAAIGSARVGASGQWLVGI